MCIQFMHIEQEKLLSEEIVHAYLATEVMVPKKTNVFVLSFSKADQVLNLNLHYFIVILYILGNVSFRSCATSWLARENLAWKFFAGVR